MLYIGILIALHIIVLTAYMLWRRFSPQGVLLVCGIVMLFMAYFTGLSSPETVVSTGSAVFDIFRMVGDAFSANFVDSGMMILSIGGYVAYMRKIKASDALTVVAMRPLSLLHKHPYVAAAAMIPIGQILFICVPSATGLALLLAGTMLPLLMRMGISRPTALSAIALSTIFDVGPGSVNSMQASSLAGVSRLRYFVDYQLEYVMPMTVLLMVVFYFSSRRADRKEKLEHCPVPAEKQTDSGTPGDIFAILPVLPILLMVFFSSYTGSILDFSIELDIVVSVLVSLMVAMVFELVSSRSLQGMFNSLKAFWDGMGHTFSSIIVLIVCAGIFSEGLISLGLVEGLVSLSSAAGMPSYALAFVLACSVLITAVITGSSNAVFFSFGHLVPGIASRVGTAPVIMILPMQLAAGMGRTVSPISGIIIAISEIGGVPPFEIVRRNLFPVMSVFIAMLVMNGFQTF